MLKVLAFTSQNGFKLFTMSALVFISYRAALDLQNLPPESTKWRVIGWLLMGVIVLANLALLAGLFSNFGGRLAKRLHGLPTFVRYLSACVLAFIPPVFFIYTEWGAYFSGAFLRFFVYLLVSTTVTLLLFKADDSRSRVAVGFLLSMGVTAFILAAFSYLSVVRTTPFSLSWSEGNRFYDYSLTFAKNLYQFNGDLRVPYNTPGRYALWGLPFLIPGLPIWVHRLWNAVLWIGAPLLLAWLLFKPVKDACMRWGATLWGALFIMQGPVYPHLLVPMILLVPFMRSKKLWVKLLAGAVISYYAGISRFTWAVLPGAWLVLDDLLNTYPQREGTWWRRLLQPVALGLAGILPGTLGTWFNVLTTDQAFAASQPLLLNRLWPNATYGEGILLGAVITTLPLLILLIWAMHSHRWQVHPLARVAMTVSLGGFAVLGLLASTKIGGGSNLHNLDMYILTLVFLTASGFNQKLTEVSTWNGHTPQWVLVAGLMAMVVPGWIAYRSGSPLESKPANRTVNALATIEQAVNEAKTRGEVLFLDQRQLLTFSYIKDVTLVSDYEKKYMMDQAMGNNAAYFDQFAEDLEQGRFALIVSDIQKTTLQDQSRAFSEENNAYVNWVSRPLLEYYEPIFIQKDFGIMLLVPKP
ncbi:MAG: hypothetical protein C0391_07220 [Anaerolinea sp.]|nr:hypothetical protein [Anaerolinea sp.]